VPSTGEMRCGGAPPERRIFRGDGAPADPELTLESDQRLFESSILLQEQIHRLKLGLPPTKLHNRADEAVVGPVGRDCI
jgi:hypothetical protein